MNEAIKISNLSKSYGTHIVLNGLDFSVQQGEIFCSARREWSWKNHVA